MIISSKPDYTFEDDGSNFRIFYVEDKIIVKAKCLPYMVIQYGNKLSTAVEQAKNRLQNMKAPPKWMVNTMRFFIERKLKEDPDKEAAIAMKWIQEIKKEQVVNGIVMAPITATTI